MIEALDTLQLDGASVLTATDRANGGNVTIRSGRLFHLLHDGNVTTSVAGGAGGGGDIQIISPLMVLDDSRIEANAFGGPGGNITIQASQLIRTPRSVIEASSKESVSGTITITAPNTDVAGSLVVPPETFLDASSQLHEACAARGGRPSSSLIVSGWGGLAPNPGAPLTSTVETEKYERPVKPMAPRPGLNHPSHSGSVQVDQALSPPGPPVFGCDGRTGR
jgi:large exoprotein involved in heme utilization and adhesion